MGGSAPRPGGAGRPGLRDGPPAAQLAPLPNDTGPDLGENKLREAGIAVIGGGAQWARAHPDDGGGAAQQEVAPPGEVRGVEIAHPPDPVLRRAGPGMGITLCANAYALQVCIGI